MVVTPCLVSLRESRVPVKPPTARAVAVEAVAHLNKILAQPGELDRLAELPRGVEGEDL
jgi:hypothetical protein